MILELRDARLADWRVKTDVPTLPGEEAFHAALEADPSDHTTRLVFADWLEEHDDPRAGGYRALGFLRRWPYRWHFTSDPVGVDRWGYHNGVGHDSDGSGKNVPVSRDHVLPQDWIRVASGHDFDSCWFLDSNVEWVTEHWDQAPVWVFDDYVALKFGKLSPTRQRELQSPT